MKKIFFKTIGLGLNLLVLLFPQWATRLAIRFFSTPQRYPVRDKERAFLDSARQVRRMAAGLPIVEFHWGDEHAPLILLSYGWEYNAGRWRHFVPAMLEAGFRVIAYDPPGHGLAANGQMNVPYNAGILRDLIETYGRPEVMIGHSFGGGSSLFALHEMPVSKHPQRMVVMAAFSYAPRIFRDFAAALGLWNNIYYRVVRVFEQRIGRRLEEFDFARMASEMSHIRGLIVHSPGDSITPFEESRRFFSFWQGAALYAPAAGGHHLGTPEVTRAILDFAVRGRVPDAAEVQHFPINGHHDMARYFAGM